MAWPTTDPPTRPFGEAPRASYAGAVATSLAQLREAIHRGLDGIEASLRQRPAADAEAADRLETLRRELDAERERLRAEAARLEEEHRSLVEEVERERALLTRSWEQLERESIELAGGSGRGSRADATFGVPPRGRPAATPGRESVAAAPAARHASNLSDSAVSRAIFQQFETLRRDVRRHVEGQDRPAS